MEMSSSMTEREKNTSLEDDLQGRNCYSNASGVEDDDIKRGLNWNKGSEQRG